MNAGGFVITMLLFGLCVYGFDACLRGFQRSRRGSRKILPYLYGAGIAIAVVVFLALLAAVFLVLMGPLH